jgi:hypothetical protein
MEWNFRWRDREKRDPTGRDAEECFCDNGCRGCGRGLRARCVALRSCSSGKGSSRWPGASLRRRNSNRQRRASRMSRQGSSDGKCPLPHVGVLKIGVREAKGKKVKSNSNETRRRRYKQLGLVWQRGPAAGCRYGVLPVLRTGVRLRLCGCGRGRKVRRMSRRTCSIWERLRSSVGGVVRWLWGLGNTRSSSTSDSKHHRRDNEEAERDGVDGGWRRSLDAPCHG